MRFLIRVLPAGVPKEKLLDSVKTISKTLGVESRSPKWTSYGGLELDIFSPTTGDFELFLTAVRPIAQTEFVKDLNVAPQHKAEAELFADARDLFNAERYWECHEILEGVWRTKQGEEKRLLQGIILVCAAFVHHQKGEQDIALGVLRRAGKQLDYRGGQYAGIDVVMLKRNADNVIESEKFSNFHV